MLNKEWEILPSAPREFMASNPKLSKLSASLLWQRNIRTAADIELFFSNDLTSQEYDPFLFKDMRAAVDIIIKNIKKQNSIVVYGDYDADGITATALLFEVLKLFHAKVNAHIPDRVSDGYGLNKNTIAKFSREKVKLIITVDNGIRNKEEVAYAHSLGMEMIITDHHQPPADKEDLPDCPIINPACKNSQYPFKFLSGAGVAYKLLSALIKVAKLEEKKKETIKQRALDILTIGTIADCVLLLNENRLFAVAGLRKINNKPRVGIDELLKVARVETKVKSWNVGFQIAPRINAAGRMGSANVSFELLTVTDRNKARILAKRLQRRNQERQKETEEVITEIEKTISSQKEKIIIGVFSQKQEADEVWREGIVGLVAGRLAEKYHRPTLVITLANGLYKGSGRSIEGFDIVAALEEGAEYLDKFGGHPMACGFVLQTKNLEKFIDKMQKIAKRKLKDQYLKPKIKIDYELELSAVNNELLSILEEFEPYGEGNQQPKFLSRGLRIVDIITMGLNGKHLKLRLNSGNSSVINAIGFGQAEKYSFLTVDDIIDLVYYVDVNEYKGRREIQLKIIDIKYSAIHHN